VSGLRSFQLSSSESSFDSVEAGSGNLAALLEKASLPYITSAEQIQLALIVDCMNEVLQMPKIIKTMIV
jgi:hypothetical protein